MSARPLTFSEWQRLSPAERQRATLARATVPGPKRALRSSGTSTRHTIPAARRSSQALHGAVILDAANPPSLPAVRGHRQIFDPAPHRNRGKVACPTLAPGLLNRVIATCVTFGMPRPIAEEARTNPYVRTDCVTLAVLVWDAAKGDKPSQAALDRIREAFGNRDAVAESFAALEQPADSGELTRLLGADR